MTYRIFLLGILTALMGVTSSYADNQPTIENVALNKAYIPVGFDDNDRTQIVVAGVFQNSCYRIGPTTLQVDQGRKTITVQQQAYLYGGVCLEMTVPFTQVVDIGLLSEGNYTVLDHESNKPVGKLPVTRSVNAGPDDFLYAPITDANIVHNVTTMKDDLVITGSFADRCSQLSDCKVIYQDEVVVVQPVMKRVGTRCEQGKTRFMKIIPLEKDLHNMFLLHVRSLNGQTGDQ